MGLSQVIQYGPGTYTNAALATVRVRLDFDFNDGPDEDGTYRVLPVVHMLLPLEPLLVVFGDSECEADGEVVGTWTSPHTGHDLWVVRRTSEIRCH